MREPFTLWLLRPVLLTNENCELWPWEPCYDRAFGFVVSARTEEEARQLASEHAGDENGTTRVDDPWRDPQWSTCEPLVAPDEAKVIIMDFASA